MTIPYRTQQRVRRLLTAVAVIAVIVFAALLCFLLWAQRYIIYTNDGGAQLDFDLPPMKPGVLAVAPEEMDVSIYFNEGENAINTSTELTQILGYYADEAALADIATVKSQIQTLSTGTAVMVDVKDIDGAFFYSSKVGSNRSGAVNTTEMDDLIRFLDRSGMYTIARLPALRDYYYGLNNVPYGVHHSSGGYLYQDDDGCYWLHPGTDGALSYLTRIITELKELGFDEVVLYDFQFPDAKEILVEGEKDVILTNAANTLMTACATNRFALSFEKTAYFEIPKGRSRIYLSGLDASQLAEAAEDSGVEDPTINLVFLTELHDTRFNTYSVLRPLSGAH